MSEKHDAAWHGADFEEKYFEAAAKLAELRERGERIILDNFNAPDDRHGSWWINPGEMFDALIAAGFGDVAAERARAERLNEMFNDQAARKIKARAERDALQARIDAAPHAYECSRWGWEQISEERRTQSLLKEPKCTCWKSS